MILCDLCPRLECCCAVLVLSARFDVHTELAASLSANSCVLFVRSNVMLLCAVKPPLAHCAPRNSRLRRSLSLTRCFPLEPRYYLNCLPTGGDASSAFGPHALQCAVICSRLLTVLGSLLWWRLFTSSPYAYTIGKGAICLVVAGGANWPPSDLALKLARDD